MSSSDNSNDRTVGPRRYFVPVCIRTKLGFIGGPSGYCETTEENAKGARPIIWSEENARNGSLLEAR